MKYLLYSLLFVNNIAFAGVEIHMGNKGFIKWVPDENFKEIVSKMPNNSYPVIIQGKALLGDNIMYRALFNVKPSEDFEYKYTYGVTKDKFTKLHIQYTEKGFTLIHLQKVQLMAIKAHQAIWVKDDL